MEMQIIEQEKLEYLVSNTVPENTDPSYAKWYAENQKIKGWLLNSMSPKIMKRYLRLPTAHGIWNALAKAFYDRADESRLFALNQCAFSTKQIGHLISTYYVEKLWVHIFHNGLNEEFEQIHGEIVRRDSMLDLEETYAHVLLDFIRQNGEPRHLEPSTMVACRIKYQ
ncbi:hypothetical protein SADUNF_Sadunf18G0070400 [Salix dunnii]|uniref:Uncharacterized protein n=1 Tax=Salix dunnii TaxID=1413687 RepID=A0A835J3T3_9ROSI|nr:hypothetical protein SADUNF_Sadunf18G0070400 [Salix dunnii]